MTAPVSDPRDSAAQPDAASHAGGSSVALQHNLAVAAGAIVGVLARFTVGELARLHLPLSFPSGTLLVNLIGCLLIGIIQTLWFELRSIRHTIQVFAAVGVLGGFTTFSTFSVETVRLLQTGAIGHALGYQALSLVGGIGAVALGSAGTRALHRRRRRP